MLLKANLLITVTNQHKRDICKLITYNITSVSKKPGQTIVLYHYCGLSRFFWNRRYLRSFLYEENESRLWILATFKRAINVDNSRFYIKKVLKLFIYVCSTKRRKKSYLGNLNGPHLSIPELKMCWMCCCMRICLAVGKPLECAILFILFDGQTQKTL